MDDANSNVEFGEQETLNGTYFLNLYYTYYVTSCYLAIAN